MQFFPAFPDFFMSPQTGRLRGTFNLPALPQGQIWVGGQDGLPAESQDLILVKDDLAKIKEASFLLQESSPLFPKAQALSGLTPSPLPGGTLLKTLAVPDLDDPTRITHKLYPAIPEVDYITMVPEPGIVSLAGEVISTAGPPGRDQNLTTKLADNLVFHGTYGVTVPILPKFVPSAPAEPGVIRYDAENHYFEGGYQTSETEKSWAKFYGEGKPTYITDTFGGASNLYIGTKAGAFPDGGSSKENTVIGLKALSEIAYNLSGNPEENVVIGFESMRQPSTLGASARYSVAIGNRSQEYAFGDYNVSLGHESLQFCGFAKRAVALGYRALASAGVGEGLVRLIQPGSGNVAVGAEALANLVYGSDNVAIGDGALKFITNARSTSIPWDGYIDGSVAIGYQALSGQEYALTGKVTDGSVAVGHQALWRYAPITSYPLGKPCIAIGYQSQFFTGGGSSNLSIGFQALYKLNADAVVNYESRNIAIGDQALYSFTTSHFWQRAHPNLAIGVRSLAANETGRGNVAIGDEALIEVKSGNFNLGIGFHADTRGGDRQKLTNAMAIGAFSKVESSNSLVLGGTSPEDDVYYPAVGIGENNPQFSLHIGKTGADNKAIIALGETSYVPGDRDPSALLYFYTKDGEAYFKSAKTGTKKIGTLRKISGTEWQIVITHSESEPVISIADDPVLPGTGAVTIPVGTKAQRPSSPRKGMLRYCTG